MAKTECEELESVFQTYAEMEGFDIAEMADEEYMASKIAIWLESELITTREYGLMQTNWGIPGYDPEAI